jgi:hypothetical protein
MDKPPISGAWYFLLGTLSGLVSGMITPDHPDLAWWLVALVIVLFVIINAHDAHPIWPVRLIVRFFKVDPSEFEEIQEQLSQKVLASPGVEVSPQSSPTLAVSRKPLLSVYSLCEELERWARDADEQKKIRKYPEISLPQGLLSNFERLARLELQQLRNAQIAIQKRIEHITYYFRQFQPADYTSEMQALRREINAVKDYIGNVIPPA